MKTSNVGDGAAAQVPIVRYYGFGRRGLLAPCSGGGGTPLAEMPLLVQEAGVKVAVAGACFELRDDGLYRFLVPYTMTRHIVVYTGASFMDFLAGIAHAHTHGHRDKFIPFEEQKERMRSDRLICTCHYISNLARHLCTQAGLAAREVCSLTLEPWTGRDEGHNMLEVRHPEHKNWMLFDLDTKHGFARDGRMLGVYEVAGAVARGESLEPVKLANTIVIDACWTVDNVNISLFYDEVFLEREALLRWYAKVLQVCMIFEAGHLYFIADGSYDARIRNKIKKAVPLPKPEWLARFYPELAGQARN